MSKSLSWLIVCGRSALCFVMVFLSAMVLTACPPPDDCLRIANPMVGAQQVESPFWLKTNGGEVYRLRDGSFIVVPLGQTLEDELKTMEECEPVTIVFSTETPTEMTSTPPVTITTPTLTETATTTADQTTPTPIPVTPTVVTPTNPVMLTPEPTVAESTPTTPLDGDGDGYTEADGDCNDSDATVNPGAEEICDGVDNDCDGEGYGQHGEEVDFDQDGYVNCTGDCLESDPASYPGATEICDGKDNDCDDVIDEDCVENTPTPSESTMSPITSTPEPTPELTPEATVAPTPLLTPKPTFTPTPATPEPTVAPTATPTPTATPALTPTPVPVPSCELMGYQYLVQPNAEHPDSTFTSGNSGYGFGELMDGLTASTSYQDAQWVAWRKTVDGNSSVLLQFTSVCSVNVISLGLLVSNADGIYTPSQITVSASINGTYFDNVIVYTPTEFSGRGQIVIPLDMRGKFFRVDITQSNEPDSWIFWDELALEF